jgi:GntR family transcriptional repressor for pyruvate dehydrogenase complex
MPRKSTRVKGDITERLIEIFKDQIAAGVLKPGGRLPPERELAETFGVARSSLRPALKVLEIMGVISQRVGDGTYVNQGARSILGEPMEFLILLDGISFHELMEARLIVEPELAARAAERATADDIAELGKVLDHMTAHTGRLKRFTELDLAFHDAVFRIAGNRVCQLMFSVVHQSLVKLIRVTAQMTECENTLSRHRRIFEAIEKHDVALARKRMTEHLVDARELLRLSADGG